MILGKRESRRKNNLTENFVLGGSDNIRSTVVMRCAITECY